MIKDFGVQFEFAGEKGMFNWIKLEEKGFTKLKQQSVVDWCLDNFGIDGSHNWFYDYKHTKFYFRKYNDMILFILRWS
jgi:hypothetical protein